MSVGTNGRADASITVQELLAQIEGACGQISAHHPTRRLLEQCRVAIIYLAQCVPDDRLATRNQIVEA